MYTNRVTLVRTHPVIWRTFASVVISNPVMPTVEVLVLFMRCAARMKPQVFVAGVIRHEVENDKHS